ncbi:DNA adenine methylase [Brachyspira pilosicoli]|uniref:site-specific DNA-methyltransferase (adenine-specific) n=1 Tax=Brachyspira pilosicoli TaxID=52584 RepID=A0AAJ6GDE2_BRAPL|nr:DNA adenine methylase [Brachyspira pilosicoli]WIH87999.1 DNA adenine methylase [Brachyspira pilosicoli]WIH90278.1 DNA adenine methylase [Brachyspira pilosicoli]WIH92569.1 DNA adenine methylase [Brachyspira pilosicoli]WIH94861.1 DNA adenine methylase [Brachyspira pilosicoli]
MITKDNYLKNNLIAYIGNKRRLLPFIENAFLNILEEDKNIKTALDLFAGSGSVSRLLKTLNLKVYSNDWEYYSYILNYAHICINEKDVKNMFKHTGGVENTINIINNIETINDKDRYISKYYAPLDDNNPDLKNERLFYTQYNATRIDIIRHNIEELYKNKAINKKEYYYLLASIIYEGATHTNTSGVFKAFHSGFGGRNKDALKRILSPISLKELSLYDGIKGEVSMLDANEYVLKNKDKHFDLVYLDPPYNQHQYGSNYHLLNTIALWDKPEINREIYINGKKTDKGGIRKDWVKTKSDYCYKKTAKDAFKNLIDNINASHIVLSYSTDGIIDYDDLISILESKGKLKIVTSEYTKYRGAKRSVINKTKNVEYLFIVDTKKINKNNKNNNIKYIENIRLKLNNPVDTIKDNLVFENKKEGNIILKLEYTTHIINQEEICQTLKNKSLEYIKLFSEFLNKHIKENNIEALKIYLSHLKNAILINDKKLIKYFSNHILTIYTRLCSKRSNEYIVDITNEILNIISYYKLNDIVYIDKIKKRIVYNISHSEISEENKNNILVKL